MLSHRGNEYRTIKVKKGPKRQGRSKGYRVRVVAGDEDGRNIVLSCYPEDARKFALELLQVADECETERYV